MSRRDQGGTQAKRSTMVPTEPRYEHRGADAGVTEPVIRSVVVTFYEKVKRDAALGPVFRERHLRHPSLKREVYYAQSYQRR